MHSILQTENPSLSKSSTQKDVCDLALEYSKCIDRDTSVSLISLKTFYIFKKLILHSFAYTIAFGFTVFLVYFLNKRLSPLAAAGIFFGLLLFALVFGQFISFIVEKFNKNFCKANNLREQLNYLDEKMSKDVNNISYTKSTSRILKYMIDVNSNNIYLDRKSNCLHLTIFLGTLYATFFTIIIMYKYNLVDSFQYNTILFICVLSIFIYLLQLPIFINKDNGKKINQYVNYCIKSISGNVKHDKKYLTSKSFLKKSYALSLVIISIRYIIAISSIALINYFFHDLFDSLSLFGVFVAAIVVLKCISCYILSHNKYGNIQNLHLINEKNSQILQGKFPKAESLLAYIKTLFMFQRMETIKDSVSVAIIIICFISSIIISAFLTHNQVIDVDQFMTFLHTSLMAMGFIILCDFFFCVHNRAKSIVDDSKTYLSEIDSLLLNINQVDINM